MTRLSESSQDIGEMVDSARGLVDRRIFSDQDIYQLELERIFARAWNFMAHDSQIPNPGDFFMTFIGEDRVICVRDNDSKPQVLVNSCRHRGNAVCRAEEGHATSFMCTYHGWTYDLKGSLVGVPGFKEVYHEELDRDSWGLIKAAQVDSYHGFIFASMDPDAPCFDDYLGDVGRMSIDMVAVQGEMKMAGGVQKHTIPCNWKFVADNIWDLYHLPVTHASTTMLKEAKTGAVRDGTPSSQSLSQPQMVWLGEYGHALAGPMVKTKLQEKIDRNRKTTQSWRERPEAKQALGLATKSLGSPHLFPNFSTTGHHATLRLPKGPHSTEIWRFCFLDQNLPADRNAAFLRRVNTIFGPGGIVEQDDVENWDQSTKGTMGTISKTYPLHYAMGMGHGEVLEEDASPPRIDAVVNEHAQLWYYRGWSEWMSAESWAELKASHSPVPTGVI